MSIPSRRQFLRGLSAGGAAALASSAGHPLSGRLAYADKPADRAGLQRLVGSADSCIMLWLGGGACQLDTWDPKLRSTSRKMPGSAYAAIDTAVAGLQVCEHLPRCAAIADRLTLVRSVHHGTIDEHAIATNIMHTGRPTSGTVVYPSIGSMVAHQRPAVGANVPAYVLMGYPSTTRGPGFLGAKYGFLYLTETSAGPTVLSRPADVDPARQARRESLLGRLSADHLASQTPPPNSPVANSVAEYAAAAAEGLRLAGPDFMRVFDLASEPASLRANYGDDFGQRCLLARRLVEAGVRFVEVGFHLNFVNGTGWDTHNEGQANQHLLIQSLDTALSALVNDLADRNRLDKTLVVVSTEFGRPPEFDGGGGRGHQSRAFSVVLAGGGLRHGRAIGVTDTLGRKIVERPVSVPDLFATIFAALGIDPAHEIYAGTRPVPLTDAGRPVGELFA